jgi:hypothetical protein
VQLLDKILGPGETALFRRAELKTLVAFHGNEARKSWKENILHIIGIHNYFYLFIVGRDVCFFAQHKYPLYFNFVFFLTVNQSLDFGMG